MARKWYVVWRGRGPGVYESWDECKAQVDGFAGATFKSFESKVEADDAFAHPPQAKSANRAKPKLDHAKRRRIGQPIADSYCVDAACSGNPGRLEFRCVHTTTRQEIFHDGPFEEGTNNIGEFLAIVHALTHLKRRHIGAPIYSDSENALRWVGAGACRSTLQRTERNAPLFELVARAERWLAENDYTNRVLKWHTEVWGENPADFGRK